jgi:SAM-dependent methyltransferase
MNCRICKSENLTKYLDLGFLPLSNNLACNTIEAFNKERFPLQVLFCPECGLSQLSEVIDPAKMFSHYVYRSGISKTFINHCREMAKELKEKHGLSSESFMIDVGSNDGTLLREFKDEIGLKIMGIDPAENLAAICDAAGIPNMTYFWGIGTARKIVNTFGKADLITATNVFAHCDNVRDFIEAAKHALKDNGALVLEFPYLIDFIENNEFDTIYFEHVSYFSISPLKRLCEEVGMHVVSVSRQNIHGGSVRVVIKNHKDENTDAEGFVKGERILGYNLVEKYEQWSARVNHNINELKYHLSKLKWEGKSIAGFAASAKGNTLLNCGNITVGTIKYIVDQTPEKIGKYSPGTGIPIVSMDDLVRTPPDYLLILSWNFFEEIKEKVRAAGYKGKFIIPIPDFKIID